MRVDQEVLWLRRAEGAVVKTHHALKQIGEILANFDSAHLQLDNVMTSRQFIQISGLV